MEKTSENIDTIEVTTELTISDIKTIDYIIDTCQNIKLFNDESVATVEEISKKIKTLISVIDKE